jgi:hypothetical protein
MKNKQKKVRSRITKIRDRCLKYSCVNRLRLVRDVDLGALSSLRRASLRTKLNKEKSSEACRPTGLSLKGEKRSKSSGVDFAWHKSQACPVDHNK